MRFDPRRLRAGEVIAGVCALALLGDMFAHWFGTTLRLRSPNALSERALPLGGGQTSIGVDAFNAFAVIQVILLLTIAVTLTMIAVTASQRRTALPIVLNVVATPLALLSTLLVAFRVLVSRPAAPLPAHLAALETSVSTHVGVRLGGWLGLALIAGLSCGTYLSMRDERVSAGDRRAQERALASEPRPAPPRAAPPGPSAPGTT